MIALVCTRLHIHLCKCPCMMINNIIMQYRFSGSFGWRAMSSGSDGSSDPSAVDSEQTLFLTLIHMLSHLLNGYFTAFFVVTGNSVRKYNLEIHF